MKLPEALDKQGRAWVPVKRICEHIGLDFFRTRERLYRAEAFPTSLRRLTGRDGKFYSMLCIQKTAVEDFIAFAKTRPRGPYKKRRGD